ncbi:MAG TPA: trypsin-like peptidase domain-containing protein [Ktedonobacterales bacterium]
MTTSLALSADAEALAERVRASAVQVLAGGRAIGSGVVWEANGDSATIVTNAHVVGATSGGNILVRAIGGETTYPATVLAVDPSRDLASLRVTGGTWRAAEIGDSAAPRVGEIVVAVGNPWGHEGAMTIGVLSARTPQPEEAGFTRRSDRPRRGISFLSTEVIQADIRLYPGNSGGPLTDAQGRVIGINSMVGGGLGFAIPSRTVQDFLAHGEQQLPSVKLGVRLVTVAVPESQRARQGLTTETATVVTGVESESPAEAAGVLVGDILLAVGDQPIVNASDLLHALAKSGTGEVHLTLLRGGRRLEVNMTPVARAAA